MDLEGYSPCQQKFYVFCDKYLNNNDNVNNYIKTIIINNLGIIDDDINFHYKNHIINFINIKNIYYECYQKESKGNEVKKFINYFFDKNNLIYLIEGFNQEGDINYINFSDQINLDIIQKLKNEQCLYTIVIHYENIAMIYNEELKKISFRNNIQDGNDKNFDEYHKINEIKYEELDQIFINDLATFFIQLLKYDKRHKIHKITEDGFNIFNRIKKKIFIEEIKKKSKINSFDIFKLSKHLELCKYYPYKESINELIYNFECFSDKEFLLVLKYYNWKRCDFIYINNKNNKGFTLDYLSKKPYKYNYEKLRIKKKNDSIIIYIKDVFALGYRVYFYNPNWNYSIRIKKGFEHSCFVELYILDNI